MKATILAISILLYTATTFSQTPPTTGIPSFASFDNGRFDAVNLQNLNVNFSIPVVSIPGRGLNFSSLLGYNSLVWVKSGNTWYPVWSENGANHWGWRPVAVLGGINFMSSNASCAWQDENLEWWEEWTTLYNGFSYTDPVGTSYAFNLDFYDSPTHCNYSTGPRTGSSTDGTSYYIDATDVTSPFVRDRTGRTIAINMYNNSSLTDTNGNIISNVIVNSTETDWKDTAGRTALRIVKVSPNTEYHYLDTSGADQTILVKYQNYSVKTAFACSGTSEYNANGTMPQISLPYEIDLPGSTLKYLFTYESTPGSSGFVTGRLAQVTVPSGGTYQYQYFGANGGINCSDNGSVLRMSRILSDGTNSGTWSYVRNTNEQTTTVTVPQLPDTTAANDVVVTFDTGGRETSRKIYSNSPGSTLLRTINTTWAANGTPATRITILENSSTQSEVDTTYNSNGLLTSASEYTWGSGSRGALLRTTTLTYLTSTNYTSRNILDRIISKTIKDGSGTVKYRQDTNYDTTTLGPCPTGAPQHSDSGYSCTFTYRGNPTSMTTYLTPATPANPITTNFTYDWFGNLITTKDALNNTAATLGYSDSWANSSCNPSSNSYAHETSFANALSQTTTFKYYACSGQIYSATDPNTQTTSYTYDSLLRPTEQDFPDQGQTKWTYTSATSTQTQVKINATPQYITSTRLLDGLGRATQQQLNSDPQGVDYGATNYNLLGRSYQVYNPTRCSPPTTNCGESTWGYTTYAYDALGRPVSMTHQDGSVTSASYSLNTATATDPAGKKRQITIDGLGRITQLTEAPGGLAYATTYSYDVFDNITSITQNGGRQRTYSFDPLNRLSSETNPESGTTNYYYTTSGGALCSGTATQVCRRTDARNITTTYSFDAVNRLTQKTYSDGTATASYGYDQQQPWGWNLSNYVGRLTSQSTSVGGSSQTAAIFNYDPLGRTILHDYCTPLNCSGSNPAFHVQYTYDLAGDVTSIPVDYGTNLTYTISSGHDAAGRTNSVTSSLIDSQHPATLFTADANYAYFPHGGLRKAAYGNGLTQTNVYNNRLQPCLIDVNNNSTTLQTCNDSTPSGNVLDFWMGYNAGSSNNGNVVNWNATGNQSFVRTFNYDSLNRIATMNQSSGNASSCSSAFSLSWTYDAWGNRTDQNVTGGTCNAFHQTVDSNNRLVGPPYQYDAAGNMTYDGGHSYFYDAENRLVQVDGTLGNCSTATVCYLYDAQGHRVRRSWPAGGGIRNTDYIVGVDGTVQSEWNNGADWGAGSWGEGYVYFGGQQLAHYHNGTTLFVHHDHVGSTRLQTDLSQNVQVSFDYLPYGETLLSGSGNWYEFAGYERDPSTNLDRTDFRQYSSTLGRWTTPDPAGLAAVDPSNPQSWNRYSYVLNNPLNLVDPLGLEGCGDDWITDPSLQGPCGRDDGGGGGIGIGIGGGGGGNGGGAAGGGGNGGGGGYNGGPPWLFCDRYLDPFCGPAGWCDPGIDLNCGLNPGSFNLDVFGFPVSRVTDPCANATLSATGVDIRQNIQQAEAAIQQGRMWGITGGSYNEARGLVGALFNYAMVVGTGMPQDIKNLRGPGTPQQRVDAGNISFGVTCPFGAEFCQFSAGVAQTLSGHPDLGGTIKTGLDTPRDNQGIRIGQDMRAAGCHE